MKIFFRVFIICALSIALHTTVYAKLTVLYSENFDNYENTLPNDWQLIDTDGKGTANNFVVQNGMLGMSINSHHSIGEIVYGDTDWKNYSFEFDMISYSGEDRNVIFAWQDENHRLGLHFTGNKLYLEKLIPSSEKTPNDDEFPSVEVGSDFPHNMVHEFRIEHRGRNIKVFATNEYFTDKLLIDFTDNSDNALLHGAIGLRVGSGATPNSSVWFDNIMVMSLETPPDQSIVPHFSQLDPEWRDDVYDHTDSFEGQHYTIGDWGCALSSTAMILKYFGYEYTPDGQIMNPATLNQYLINNDGYTDTGLLVWGAVEKFAAEAQDTNNQTQPSLLSYSSQTYQSPSTVASLLDDQIPAIIKLEDSDEVGVSTHFAVANQVEGEDVILNDPLDLEYQDVELENRYPSQAIRVDAFIPNQQSSGSKIYGYIDSDKVEVNINKSGELHPVDQQTVHPIRHSEEEGVKQNSQPQTQVVVENLEEDTYQLSFIADETIDFESDWYMFTQDFEQLVHQIEGLILSDHPYQIELVINPDQEGRFQLDPVSNWSRVSGLIDHYNQAGQLHRSAYKQLKRRTNMVSIASFLPRYQPLKQALLVNYINNQQRGNKIAPEAAEAILSELNQID